MRLWLIATLAMAGTAEAATTYYVQMGGDDFGPGSSAQPWGTLQKAADSVAPGDTVIVRAGAYAGFDLRTGGTQPLPITFHAEANVSITSDNGMTPDGINVEGEEGSEVRYVVIEGFTASQRTRSGIRAVRCQHVTIRGNKTDANGVWGIFTGFCDDLLIEGNECSNSVAQHGIYVSNSGDRPVIRSNISHDNHANGIHMNGDLSQGGDGIISGALVETNVIYGNGAGGGSGINCDGVQSSVFRNNLLFTNHASGISLYMIDGAAGARDNVVVNNTILVAADGRWALNIQNASTGNKLYNNILFHAGTRGAVDISADSLTGFVSNHNVVTDWFVIDEGSFISLAAWRTMTGQDVDSVVGTPADTFADSANGNYRPKPAGPAAGRGDPGQAPPTDLDGTPRTPPVEAGAYELGGGPPPADAGPGAPDARPVPDGPPGTADARPMADAAPVPDGAPMADAAPVPDGGPGAPDAAAAGADAPGVPQGEVTGCSCRTSGDGSSPDALAPLTVVILTLRRRRGAHIA